MKKLTTTLCLTVALVMGFNTMASNQGFEAGKSYTYKEDLPDTDTVQRLAIKIGKDGKTYQATIFSGKYKYTCPRGKILAEEKLELVKCENIKETDADNILLGGDELADFSQSVGGKLDISERIINVFDQGGSGTAGHSPAAGLRSYHFSLKRPFKRGFQPTSPVVKVKPKMKRTPPKVKKDPLAQKLVTLKTLLKGGLISQKDYNAKRAAILKEMSKGKVDPIVRKLKKIQKLLDQKLITPADATYKRRKILDAM